MKVIVNDADFVIQSENNNITTFIKELEENYSNFLSKNIIIDLSEFNVAHNDVEAFQAIQDQHQANNKTFVIVLKDFDYNEVAEGLNLVPTLQEAYDIIEMEDIQRDLGF